MLNCEDPNLDEAELLYSADLDLEPHNLVPVYEHGQWWLTCQCGAQWSAHDRQEDGEPPHFGFEQVTEGEEGFHDDAEYGA